MRLLMITQDFPPAVGGIQTYSAELARRLATLCERFELVAPHDVGQAEADSGFAFPVHRLAVGSDAMAAASVPATLRLTRGARFDAVFHAQWYTAPAGLAARKLGSVRRVFVAAHGRELLLNVLEPVPFVGRTFVRVRRRILRGADRCLAVSRYTGTLLERQGVDSERVAVIPNGVDAEVFAPMEADLWRREHGLGRRPILLTVCRLVRRKGIDTVLHSLRRVCAEVPDLCYVVAGTGPDRERLERLAVELGLRSNVRFIGPVPQPRLREVFCAANVFVMPARSDEPDVEGFGLVFLEANACGVPVVGARAGGVPDAIVPGETGMLVTPGDARELGDVLAQLLADPSLAHSLGEQGRRRVLAGYTWDHVARRLFDTMGAALA